LRSAIAYCHYLGAPRLRLLGHGTLLGCGRLLRKRLLLDATVTQGIRALCPVSEEIIGCDLTGTGAQDAAFGGVAWEKLSAL
jgi:hypothetical protein